MTDTISSDPTRRTAAAAALARGQPALGRSFRLHRKRGAFCHAGWCQQCAVRLSDGARALACRIPDGAGSALGAGPDSLRIIGRFAEHFPPWFHEHRFLKPRAMRQVYLGLLRQLSAAMSLPAHPPARQGSWREAQCHTLVVGGGLAGMTAAAALSEAGSDVLLVEAEALGGAARFVAGATTFLRDAGARLRASKARGAAETLCLGLYEDGRRALCSGPEGPFTVTLQALVVATGAYDRLLSFAGNDLPGIVGLRAFERLCAARAVPAGWRIGALSAAEAAPRIAAAAESAGLRLAWMTGPERIEGSALPPASIRAAAGRGRVRAVELQPGGRMACDLLVLGFSQPTYELQMQAGLRASLAGEPATIVPEGGASLPLLVVGEAAGCAHPGEAAAQAERAVRSWLGGAAELPRPKPAFSSSRPAALASPEAFICPCEDVRLGDIERAVADGFADVDLVKRRTGAGTGPCQGKLCHPGILRCLQRLGVPVALPTVRPLLRPVPLAALAGAEHG